MNFKLKLKKRMNQKNDSMDMFETNLPVLLQNNPIILSLEGNIGSGKSTYLSKLKQQYPSWNFIDEPVDTWSQFKNEKGETLLEVYYNDKARWSFSFQNFVFLTRVMNMIKTIGSISSNNNTEQKLIFVTERCVESDYRIFAKMLHDDGFINQLEWDIYRQWYAYLTTSHKIDGIIYITCPPEKCLQRIQQRNRQGENSIPLEYLEKLHNYHEEWINKTSTPILRVDTSKDSNDLDTTQLDEFIETLI